MMFFYIKLFGISLIMTIIIETALALAFKIRKKSLLIVVLVNVLTNPIVVWVVHFLDIRFPMVLFPELSAFAVEGLIYYLFNKKEGYEIKRPFLVSFVLNTVSYVLGMVIRYFIS